MKAPAPPQRKRKTVTQGGDSLTPGKGRRPEADDRAAQNKYSMGSLFT